MKGLQFFGNRVEDAAKRLGVSVGTIGRVINKKSYRDENIDRKR
jgi:DNA-binding LacI/PurR family transcriptional regulator